MKKEYYTKTEYDIARGQNLADFLINMGYELKKEGNGYRGVLHNSFVIPNAAKNEWHWNSRDLHGREPINAVSAILQVDYGYDRKDAYISAIKRLAGTEGQYLPTDKPYTPPVIVKPEQPKDFVLPEKNDNIKRTLAYLCQTRKLDKDIVKSLAKENRIYESKQYHNAVFVAYDKDGNPRHAFLRGTNSAKDFKKDMDNADKSFGFVVPGNQKATKVYCFESSIDAISHATLFKMHGHNYKDVHRLALGGTSFLALDQFLKDNPKIETIVACLDNDPTGNLRSEKMQKTYSEQGYKTARQVPRGKDFNEMLIETVHIKETIMETQIENEGVEMG